MESSRTQHGSEARGLRHESRAGTTYARFLRSVAYAANCSWEEAERYAIAVIATLEERLPFREVMDLEAQLPSRLDDILAFQPLIGMPAMDGALFCERVASRAGVTATEAGAIARAVFAVLRDRVSPGEVRHVEARLPDDMKALWRWH